MNTGTTSALFVRLGLVAGIACAPVTALLAQGAQTTRSTQTQTDTKAQATARRLIVPVTGTLGTAAASTTAPTDTLTTQPTPAAVPITAPSTTATGSFSIQRFTRTTDDSLAAFGTLTLSFTDPASNALRTIVTQAVVPLRKSASGTAAVAPENQAQPIKATAQPAPATQGCETLSLALGPLQLDLTGTSIQLQEMNIDFTAMPGASGQLGTQLCDVSKQFDGSALPSETMKTLNTLLDTIG